MSNGISEIIWQGEISITSAEQLHAELLAALETTNPLRLDLTGVESIDLAGLQLLLALTVEPSTVERSVTLVGADNRALRELLAHAGLAHWPGLSVPPAGVTLPAEVGTAMHQDRTP